MIANEQLIHLRPQIPQAETTEKTTEIESFQNQTLRPVIKFLNDNLLLAIKFNLYSFNKNFPSLPFEKKVSKLRTFLEKNQKIKAFLQGMILGLMTDEEAIKYFKNPSEYNKRIMQMIEQRTIDHIDFFK
ncbi:MAG: glyoxalase [Crocinitomicaceae bacterium]